jgi:hypothetical protein
MGPDHPLALDVLRLVVLRGQVAPRDVAAALGLESAGLDPVVDRLHHEGLLDTAGAGTLLVTNDLGRFTVAVDLARTVDEHGDTFTQLLGEFRTPNATFKELVTTWQLQVGVAGDVRDRDAGEHLVQRLRVEVHTAVTGLIGDAVEAVPRFERYEARLSSALAGLERGDHRYMASPFVESYHTVWFELHEELIGLAGSTRAAEEAPPAPR